MLSFYNPSPKYPWDQTSMAPFSESGTFLEQVHHATFIGFQPLSVSGKS
jgi:hypothetical protein